MLREDRRGNKKPRLFVGVTLADRIRRSDGTVLVEAGLPTRKSVHHWLCKRTALPDVALMLAVVRAYQALRFRQTPAHRVGILCTSFATPVVALSEGDGSPAFSHLPASNRRTRHWRDDRLRARRLSSVWYANFGSDGNQPVRVWHREVRRYRKWDFGVVHSVTVCGQDSTRMGWADPDPLKRWLKARLCRRCLTAT